MTRHEYLLERFEDAYFALLFYEAELLSKGSLLVSDEKITVLHLPYLRPLGEKRKPKVKGKHSENFRRFHFHTP